MVSELAAWYPQLKLAHVLLVTASGALFALRGVAVLAGAGWPRQMHWRIASVAIDTALLAAGVTLWNLLQLNPLLRDHWLGAKLLLLVAYVVLGTYALKDPKRGARSTPARAVFLLLALIAFATMVSIALTRHPLGAWRIA